WWDFLRWRGPCYNPNWSATFNTLGAEAPVSPLPLHNLANTSAAQRSPDGRPDSASQPGDHSLAGRERLKP
ncbi:MAG TPA: hypothetical protein VH393_02595, partial [Ktedonobacterales bacterium]